MCLSTEQEHACEVSLCSVPTRFTRIDCRCVSALDSNSAPTPHLSSPKNLLTWRPLDYLRFSVSGSEFDFGWIGALAVGSTPGALVSNVSLNFPQIYKHRRSLKRKSWWEGGALTHRIWDNPRSDRDSVLIFLWRCVCVFCVSHRRCRRLSQVRLHGLACSTELPKQSKRKVKHLEFEMCAEKGGIDTYL